MRITVCTLMCAVLPAVAPGAAAAQRVSAQLASPRSAHVEVVGHVVEPRALDPAPDHIAALELPPGFELSVFARDLVNPRMLAVAGNGTVYVTRRSVGDVVMLRDEDADGTADGHSTVANRPGVHGIAIDGTAMYLVTVNDVYRAEIAGDGTLGELERIVDDLPDGGQHPNRTIAVGPDSALYVSVGSTCNACGETNPESATLLRIAPDGSSRTIYASGLRNTIGFAFGPEDGTLWGMDHGIDWLGDNEQHEELNRIVEGATYGWPYVYADGNLNPQDEPPGGISLQAWAERSTDPIGLYVPHAAPMQMTFYTGDAFPAEYRGDAFVAMRGSWNRNPPSGYEVVRIRFENGRPAGFEPFLTGFLLPDGEGWAHLGRLAGIAQTADGALLVSDDANGIIYRIAHTGAAADSAAVMDSTPTNAEGADPRVLRGDAATTPPDTPDELAIDIVANGDSTLTVSSAAFGDGDVIPEQYAAEGQNVSPPLSWGEAPAGTRSWVVMVEDPDVAQDPPFVHWLLYNVPGEVTELREALPPLPRLEMLEGALQGMNERGSVGWFGPRPPAEDPPHTYHFQVFALDTFLDLPHGASRAELLRAMEGRVLARGQVVGTFER